MKVIIYKSRGRFGWKLVDGMNNELSRTPRAIFTTPQAARNDWTVIFGRLRRPSPDITVIMPD